MRQQLGGKFAGGGGGKFVPTGGEFVRGRVDWHALQHRLTYFLVVLTLVFEMVALPHSTFKIRANTLEYLRILGPHPTCTNKELILFNF